MVVWPDLAEFPNQLMRIWLGYEVSAIGMITPAARA